MSQQTLFIRTMNVFEAESYVHDLIVQVDSPSRVLFSYRPPVLPGKSKSRWGAVTEADLEAFQVFLDSLNDLRIHTMAGVQATDVVTVYTSSECSQMLVNDQPERVVQTRANSALRYATEKAGVA